MDLSAPTSQTLRPGLLLSAMLLAVTLPACGSSAASEDAAEQPGAGAEDQGDSGAESDGNEAGDANGDANDDAAASDSNEADDADSAAQGEDPEGSEDPRDSEDPEDSADEPEAEPAELPGGGDTLFPDRRFVAAYGAPGIPALGVMGEGSPEDAAERVKFYAEQYQEHSEEPVQPAFEIITSIAISEPGVDGNYTNALDPEVIEPWVDLAAEEEIYVVLDLQPGHASFLDQAQDYEELLAQPHVGLALDPEWRLSEGQRHMEQIGSVTAEEINQVSDWLAGLTEEHELPQKLLVLHQFKHAMITDREDIDTSHEELAILLHADGHGTPSMKTETYESLQRDLSEDIWLGWKNFYDEDSPTFTSAQTFALDPTPWFVSYQ
ncbi:hypothetical protein [Nesterenkonia sandarakina]|uniref:Uncharacterized protein n=1 Tax=Nesterenkonia sandarakina TaxID=272918 RepID=A0A7Z0J474_9MICC|nr:hypothetical protein [Nesterenkonia sandarakina]NYJ18035.1 hypothetical protein [Nesterenkonia sandarakina]